MAPMVRTLTDIPGSEVDQVVEDFASEGAEVTRTRQSNGLWTVRAVFNSPPGQTTEPAEPAGDPSSDGDDGSPAGGEVVTESAGEPAWLTIARGELGVKEVDGSGNNPRILEYHATTSLGAITDEVPWCAAFVSFCLIQADQDSKRSARARDWLDWGREIADPEVGCVVVLRRGSNPARGHVGFFVADEGETIALLGGNQGDAVTIASKPKSDILGFRMPA